MNETDDIVVLTTDLQRAPAQRVIYLEGKTDVPIFFALLGLQPPRDAVHQGVLVRALTGATKVKAYTELAARSGSPYDIGIYGVTDGDGEALSTLSASFVAPFAGPCFRWPAYCIENFLVKTGWPSSWGTPPEWTQVLLDHVPYSALNRVHVELRQSLVTLHLAKHWKPMLQEPLKTVAEVSGALARDKHLIAGYDVETRFREEVAAIETSIGKSLDEGHAVVNGKWLVEVFAPRCVGPHKGPERCRDEWAAHAVSVGGLREVRDLWQRITGRAPT